MSSIMRWRNGLMGLSVIAITPVSHEVLEPHDLETGRAILLIPTSNPPRARSRWGVYRESGLVHGGKAVTRNAEPNTTHKWARVSNNPIASAICGNSGVGEKPSSARLRTAWAS